MPVLLSSNAFITIRATQPNIHVVAPIGIFIWGDICSPFPTDEYIFTLIDTYSSYPEVVLIKLTSLKSLIKELKSIFLRHDYQLTLKTDSGLNLVSVEIKSRKGIHHAKSATY